MHYKNGREAKNGDKVVLLPSYGPPVAGILYDAAAGNDYCNGKLAITTQHDPCPNLKECLHFDDLKNLDVPDSTPITTAPKSEPVVVDREKLAGVMYTAYCSAVGGVAFNGDPLPNWTTFRADPSKSKQSDAWLVAANATQG